MTTQPSLAQALSVEKELHDELLQSLVFLTKYYGKPFSAQSLSAGLPLVDGKLTPELLPRAAHRGGLEAKLVKKNLSEIAHALFPCILMLEGGRTCVLLSIDDDIAKITWSELNQSAGEIKLDELTELYTGYCFLVKKLYRFDERSKATLNTKEGHWFWSTLKLSMPIYRDVLLAALFISLFAVASPLFVMNVYDRVVPNLAVDTLWVLSIGMCIVILFDFILKELRSYLLDIAAKKSDVLLSARIFEKVLNIKMANRPASVGAFARNIQDFESIREFITSATIATLIDVPFSILFILIVAFVAGPLAIIPLSAILVMLVYSFWIKNKIKIEVEKGVRFSIQKNAHLIETLSGIESLKLAGAESQFQQKWEELVGNIATWSLKVRKYATLVGSVSGMLTQLTTVFIVIGGVYLIIEGEMSMGALIAAVMLSGRALAPFNHISILATRYNQAESALVSLNEVMEQPEEDFNRYLHRPYIEGEIQFSQVKFAYPNAQNQVLDNINLKIKPNEKVAILGRIGAGKTTIERLLLGFYQPTEGALRIDGIDINQLSPADLRQKIGCLPQDINLFYGTIRDNITLGVPHVSDEVIVRAARLAGVTNFTDVDPEGLDRQVGEKGAYMSGGQRQAIALARALLFNPPILVLDEPTSNMDNQTEQSIRQQLSELVQDKTFVLITHKLSMLELVDRVIVLDKGKIVADGPKLDVLDALRSGKVRAPSHG